MFVGRADPLAQLSNCVREVAAGRKQTVLLEGLAGVGKSALVQQWLSDPTVEQFSSIRAFCDTTEQDWAFGVADQLARRIEPYVRQKIPFLAGGMAGASPVEIGAQLLTALDDLQSAGPVAMVIEDSQWADEESLKALGYVLRRLEADAVLTVMVLRSGERDAEERVDQVRRLAGAQQGCHLRLDGLGRSEVRQLATQMTGGREITQIVAERLYRHTAGNPLYLQTLLAELSVEQLANEHEALPVPPGLDSAIRLQLSGLPEPARFLAEAAAILDARLPLALAAAVARLSDPAAALEPCLAAGLLRWWPDEPTTPVTVSHALQRDAILGAISPTRRRELHANAVPLVARDASWRHRVAAVDGFDPKLASSLEDEAAQLLTDRQAERAATLLLWASDLASGQAERERLLLLAGAHLIWAERLARFRPLLEKAALCEPTPTRDLVLGSSKLLQGELTEGESLLIRAVQATERLPSQQWIASMASYWLGISYIATADGPKCVDSQKRALDFKASAADYGSQHKSYFAYGCGMTGGAAAAERALQEIAPLPEAGSVAPSDAFILSYRGLFRSYGGKLTQGSDDLWVALQLAREHSIPIWAQDAHLVLAMDQYLLGAWDDSLLQVERGRTISVMEDKPWGIAMACAFGSLVPAGRGEWETADELLRQGEELAQFIPNYSIPWQSIGRATLAQARGDYAAMYTALEPMFRLPGQGIVEMSSMYWQPLLTEALIGIGDFDSAETALARLVKLAENAPCLQVVCAFLRGQLAEARSDTDTAQISYDHGVMLSATTTNIPFHRSRLEHAYSRLLMNLGKDQAAEALRSSATRLFAKLGAKPFLQRCEGSLNNGTDAGFSPRATAPNPLTDREHDIARLAADGLTNREIASRLFVSTKTVEFHLSHVFAKLGITGRRELRHHEAIQQ